ncbi:MAG: zinc ribbon domain-containing protein [Gemmatimonadota bacterium]|nr:zinc ribbon domain-containing protein [Gemmatimonadota bacterium]MDH5758148.1 zinc ribbon domain-containing protein [Gemmatimonadota bacterium]
MTSLLGAVLVTAMVVFFILQPVVKGLQASLAREDDELTDTEARKRVALLALRDVEFDFLSGKLDEEDYRNLKGEFTAEALAALEAHEAALDGTATEGDEDLEAEIALARESLRGGVPCGECGYGNAPGSRFCSSCGSGLTRGASAGHSPATA